MSKEESLSDEIEWWGDVNKHGCPENEEIIRVEQIKEKVKQCFIDMEKRLIGNKIKYQDVVLIIKRRFGDKLTQNSEVQNE